MRKEQLVRGSHHQGRAISLAPRPVPVATAEKVSWWLGADRLGFYDKAHERYSRVTAKEAEMSANILYANVIRHGTME